MITYVKLADSQAKKKEACTNALYVENKWEQQKEDVDKTSSVGRYLIAIIIFFIALLICTLILGPLLWFIATLIITF